MTSRTINLTPKQRHFCRAAVSCSNMSDAYREAYNTANMKPATINREAHTLMSDPKIAARVESVQRVKDCVVLASNLSDRERVLAMLREFMETAQPSDSAKIRACELLGKSIGLLKHVVETKIHRSTEEILADINQRLAKDNESLH